jgi:hypothetical protein
MLFRRFWYTGERCSEEVREQESEGRGIYMLDEEGILHAGPAARLHRRSPRIREVYPGRRLVTSWATIHLIFVDQRLYVISLAWILEE